MRWKHVPLLAFLGMASGCYVVQQGVHHAWLLASGTPVHRLLEDPTTPAPLRQQLTLIEEAVAFAENEGLVSGGAYRSYIDLGGRPVSYLVHAAKPLALEPVTWWFPLVGDVPYLGFYDQADRQGRAAELEAAGYDVFRASAAAFSTLGWFADPVFSNMVEYRPSALAGLIFHELTHTTLWIPGGAEWNEQLATFVEGHLAAKFFHQRNDTKAQQELAAAAADDALFYDWLQDLKSELAQLYARYQQGQISEEQALLTKATILAHYNEQRRPKFKVWDRVGQAPWNNARILATHLYSPDIASFERLFRCKNWSNMGSFLQQIRDWAQRHPLDSLRASDACTRLVASG